jgi:hypothetical protein
VEFRKSSISHRLVWRNALASFFRNEPVSAASTATTTTTTHGSTADVATATYRQCSHLKKRIKRLSTNIFLAPRLNVEKHLTDWHLAERNLANIHLFDRHLPFGHLSFGQLAFLHLAIRHLTFGHLASGHLAIGHLAFGHLAFGHLAFRHLAFGHLAIGHLAFRHLVFGHLAFRHLAIGHLAFRHLAFGHLAYTMFGRQGSFSTEISVGQSVFDQKSWRHFCIGFSFKLSCAISTICLSFFFYILSNILCYSKDKIVAIECTKASSVTVKQQ